MSKVLVKLKVFPEGIEVDLEKLKLKIEQILNPEKIEIEEVAFGLKCLVISKIIDDEGGILEEIENKLRAIEGVSNIETVYIGRTI